MTTKNITVCIFAFNEEKRIIRCINNFKNYEKILVVDNYSTDATKNIVESEGIRCVSIKNPNFIETPEVMNLVLQEVDTEYILIASVSEYVPLTLLQMYVEVANTGSHDVVRAFRVSMTAGQPIPISGLARQSAGELRFFRNGSVDFTGNQVHGHGRVLSPQNRVLNVVNEPSLHFYQFRDYDCSHTEIAHCRYDDILARQRYAAGQRFTLYRALYYSFKAFLTCYVRFGSLRFGMLGFLHSYYRWQMEFTVWLRIWECEKGYTREDVIRLNSIVRQQLEAEVRIQQVN